MLSARGCAIADNSILQVSLQYNLCIDFDSIWSREACLPGSLLRALLEGGGTNGAQP